MERYQIDSDAEGSVAALAADTKSAEIVGCCEVIEERLDVSQRPYATRSERQRSRTARRRPVIENLCVKRGYRRRGVGAALVRACEGAVRRWDGQDEIFSQVDCDNVDAYNLFRKCGYACLFADSTCTKVVLDDVLFAKEVPVTKQMMRKMLNDEVSLTSRQD
ncbi:hypothetical protein ACHAW5_005901 [Stephanodiscus triporus]|uniref:N-acetyltransferase domain-containing protein n=1 Tax=Stephanodiscus triporus TaxID=2934178 RepID=A0ABD3NA96_9STRA